MCSDQIPVRVVLCALLLWSSLNAYVLRVNMSLSIVAMVGTKQTNISTSTQINSSGCPKVDDGSTVLLNNNTFEEISEGEFDWSEATQGTILSAFFWGYMVLQAPGGRLAELIGGRRVMGTAMLIASLLSIATPPLARVHHSLLVAVRAVQGLLLGVHFPTSTAIVTHWVPLDERSRFLAVCMMGGSLGLALMLPLCGLVIAYLGWPALFYLSGAHGLLFTLTWFVLVHDKPEQHPRITQAEYLHIKRGLVGGSIKTLSVPWKSALTSFQVWVPFIATLGSDWGFYTLLTLGPKYMSSIFGVNIQQNGVLSALPYLFRYVFGIFAGLGVDFALRHKLLSLLILRRCAVFMTHVLPALMLMAFPFVGCDLLPAIALLCMSMACNGAITSGHFQGYMDIAPNFAATLTGLSNGLGSIMGVISPLIIGSILDNDASISGWRIAFALSASLYAVSSLPFLCCFSARVQPWNEETNQADETIIKLKN